MARKNVSLHALGAQLRGAVTVGAEWRGEIVEDNLVAEVTVRVRRRVSGDDERGFREGALEALRRDTYRVRHCECGLQRVKWFGSTKCSGRVVAAVVYSSLSGKEPHHRFVCSRHRDPHGIRGEYVLAVVDLREKDLLPIRAQAEADERAHHEKWRAEQAALDAKGGA